MDITDYRYYLIEPSIDTNLIYESTLFVFVQSKDSNGEKRKQIRETWANRQVYSDYHHNPIYVIFAVGLAPNVFISNKNWSNITRCDWGSGLYQGHSSVEHDGFVRQSDNLTVVNSESGFSKQLRHEDRRWRHFAHFGIVSDSENNLKVPHVGWNSVAYKNNCSLFNEIPNDSDFYFVHSYHYKIYEDVSTGETRHGEMFTSSIQKNNIYGFQFHPEKSQSTGLKIISNFVNL